MSLLSSCLLVWLLLLLSGDVEMNPGPEEHVQLETFLRNEGIGKDQRNRKVEERNLYKLAGLFDDANIYVDELNLTPAQKTDVQNKIFMNGNQMAMKYALQCWRNRNPIAAKFKTLLYIVVQLDKIDVAQRICTYLHKEYPSSEVLPPPIDHSDGPAVYSAEGADTEQHQPAQPLRHEGPLSKVTKVEAPVITTHPEDIAVLDGTSKVVLKTTARGEGIHYQWRKRASKTKERILLEDNNHFHGVHTQELTITIVSGNDSGLYSCTVKNAAGSVVSKEAKLSVGVAIVQSPSSQHVVEAGSSISLAVRATGSDLLYQWFRNGQQLESNRFFKGTTTNMLHITGANAQQVAGNYTCKVSNTINEKMSSAANVEIIASLPRMVTHPTDVEATNGEKIVIMSVFVEGAHLNYQWKKHRDPSQTLGHDLLDGDIYSGTTTCELQIRTISTKEEGWYSCQVRNARGTVSSNKAQLRVKQGIREMLRVRKDFLMILIALVLGVVGVAVHLHCNTVCPEGKSCVFHCFLFGYSNKSSRPLKSSLITLDRKPELPKLRNFPLSDGGSIDIAQQIAGMGYERFSTLLLNDKDGTKLSVIKAKEKDPVVIVVEILIKWLHGGGATWRGLVSTLKNSELNDLAQQIEASFTV